MDMENVRTVDLNSLPVAGDVRRSDSLLLMREGDDGTSKCMLAEKRTFTKKKRVRRYVIGRALVPGSWQDSGHENWYCYGCNGSNVILPIRNTDVGEPIAHLYINGEELSLKQIDTMLHGTFRVHMDDISLSYNNVIAFCVDKCAHMKEGFSLWLSRKIILAPAISGESTHHAFTNGRRVYKRNAPVAMGRSVRVCPAVTSSTNIYTVTRGSGDCLIRNCVAVGESRLAICIPNKKVRVWKRMKLRGKDGNVTYYNGYKTCNIWRKRWVAHGTSIRNGKYPLGTFFIKRREGTYHLLVTDTTMTRRKGRTYAVTLKCREIGKSNDVSVKLL